MLVTFFYLLPDLPSFSFSFSFFFSTGGRWWSAYYKSCLHVFPLIVSVFFCFLTRSHQITNKLRIYVFILRPSSSSSSSDYIPFSFVLFYPPLFLLFFVRSILDFFFFDLAASCEFRIITKISRYLIGIHFTKFVA